MLKVHSGRSTRTMTSVLSAYSKIGTECLLWHFTGFQTGNLRNLPHLFYKTLMPCLTNFPSFNEAHSDDAKVHEVT